MAPASCNSRAAAGREARRGGGVADPGAGRHPGTGRTVGIFPITGRRRSAIADQAGRPVDRQAGRGSSLSEMGNLGTTA
jgi:hypothetical protein